VLPIENSPPGIQTIPAGAGPGGVDVFEVVGTKVIDPTDGHDSHSVAVDKGVAAAGLSRRIVNPTTAPIAMTLKVPSQKNLAFKTLLLSLEAVFRDF
jgi:hypothetical protein